VKKQDFAGLDFFGGFDEGCPVVVRGGETLREEDFYVASGCGRVLLGGEASSGGEETCGDDAGIVEDEEVAGLEERWEIGEDAIGIRAGVAVESHHAAGAAHGWRLLRDEVFGKCVVEVGDEHRNRDQGVGIRE
jgi:hypothetical protein